MKKMHCAVAVGLLFLVGACSYYSIVKQTPPAPNLGQFSTISVGWLDLDENKWKDYGFEEKDKAKWADTVNDLNLNKFPGFLKQMLAGKKVLTVKSKVEEPQKEGLLVVFSEVNYAQRTSTGAQIMFGGFAGSDTLDLTVRFIEAATGKELHSVTVSLESKAGTGYSQWGFEGRVTNAVYNLARFLSEKVM